MRKILIIYIFLKSFFCYAEENELYLQKNIFKFNFDALHSQFETEIKKINNENNIDKIIDSKKINLTKYKMILENLTTNSKSDLVLAESYFRLSLITFEENSKDLQASIEYLKKSLDYINKAKSEVNLDIKINFFAGGLYLLNEEYDKSENYYQETLKIIEKANIGQLFSEEKIRSLIGLGDGSYFQGDFSSAVKEYQLAYKVLKDDTNLLQENTINIESLIYLRTILSNYRNADYKSTLVAIKNYAYNREIFRKYNDDVTLRDVKNIGGISLFELKNNELFKEISADKVYGDFGKEIILQSFPLFIKAGNGDFVDDVAKNIKDDFFKSINYIYFLKEWTDANKENEDKDKFFYVCYLSSTEIAKNSIWRSRFLLDKKQDDYRKNMVLNYSGSAAEYYYENGIKSKSISNFLRSAEIYSARLEENDKNDNRGLLLQKYSESLYMGEDYIAALNAIERSLRFNLEDRYLKSGLFLNVKITRMLSSNVLSTSDNNYKLYESAVDSFVIRFPSEQQARDGLFESAKRAELLGDFENARMRYERLMSYNPKQDNEIIREEKNRNSQSLAAVLLKIKDKNKINVEIASDLESYSNSFDVNNITKSIITSTNSKLAQNYYQKLNNEGKIKESAEFLSVWAQNNEKNIDSSKLYINSIEIFAQLQDWKKVLLLSKKFENLYPKDERLPEAFFWQGKASDELLLFAQASKNYEKSANASYRFPSIKDKLFAIDRAITLYDYLHKKEDEAKSIELKSVLLTKINSNINKISLEKMKAAAIYFSINKKNDAKRIYASLNNTKYLSKSLQEESRISALMSNVGTNKNLIPEIDLALSKYAKSNHNKEFIENTITFLNNYDNKIFQENENKFRITFNANNLDHMDKLVKRLEKRSSYLRSNLSYHQLLVDTYLLSGKMSESFAKDYVYCYNNYKKNDTFLKYSEQYHIAARKFYSAALSVPNIDEIHKIKVYLEAQNYFKIPEKFSRKVLFYNQTNYSKVLPRLYSDNKNIFFQNLAKKKD